jgi:regulator of RNase E activity RraA
MGSAMPALQDDPTTETEMPYTPPPPPEILPLTIADQELCRRYERLMTGAVNDVLREEHLLDQALPPAVAPLEREMRVAGIVFTVKGMKSLTVDGEMEQRAAMLEAIRPCSVVVWDTGGDDTSAQWGEVMTKAAIRAGCRGAIIDGGIRDTSLILAQNFPIWCRYRTSNAMLGRFRMVGYQIPIRIGNVTLYPGDVVFADIDGAVVVPRRLAVEVLERAERIVDAEQQYKRWIDQGMSAQDVVKNGGYF